MSSPDDPISDIGIGDTQRDFRDGQRFFNRYLLKGILGRGGMGIVWRAFDEELNRDVALKFLPPEVVLDEHAIKDLKRETVKSQELRHHHIVQVYDFVTDRRSACIAMEYVDGATLSALKARNERRCLEVDDIEAWVEQLCEALHYAHERAKVIHRDLKPANLMVNSKGELKVTDFGIARSVSDSMSMLSKARGTSGTLVYMSPQQLDGERVSPADDIYSLGATIYELLASRPPFYSGNIDRQVREKIPPSMAARREEFDIESKVPIPQVWEEVIAACLSKSREQRPQSAKQVIERLKSIGGHVPPRTPPETPLPATVIMEPPPRKQRSVAITIAVASVILLAVIGAFIMLRPGANVPVIPALSPTPYVAPAAIPQIQATPAPAPVAEYSAVPQAPISTAIPWTAPSVAPRESVTQPSASIAEIPSSARGDFPASEPLRSAELKEKIGNFLQNWSRAWADEDMPAYGRLYASEFIGRTFSAAKGWKTLDKAGWMEDKRSKASQQSGISVEVRNLVIQPTNAKEVEVTFTQAYASSKYTDTGRKQMLLRRESGGDFLIVREDFTPDGNTAPIVANPPSVSSTSNSNEVYKTFVERWRQAWESKDINSYGSFYSSEFVGQKTSRDGTSPRMNRSEWLADKQQKWRSGSISVQIDDLTVKDDSEVPGAKLVSFSKPIVSRATMTQGAKLCGSAPTQPAI